MECINCTAAIGDSDFHIHVADVGDYCSEYCFQQNTQGEVVPGVRQNVPPPLKHSKKA